MFFRNIYGEHAFGSYFYDLLLDLQLLHLLCDFKVLYKEVA